MAFRAIDFGGEIRLNDFLRRQLFSAEREERNQCTLIALDAGIASFPSRSLNIPAKSRVPQLALDLRVAKWRVGQPFFAPPGISKSQHGETIILLFRDIVHVGNDIDYRILCLFPGAFPRGNRFDIRVFDALHSGSGDTALHINAHVIWSQFERTALSM